MRFKKSIFVKLFIGLIALGIAFFLGFLIYANIGLKKEIDLSLIKAGSSSVTKIYAFDRNDGLIDTDSSIELEDQRIFFKNSEWCSYYDMPENLIKSFIAVEDRRFYEHNGVDWLRTGKATLNYIFRFDDSGYGGSTITQQLIKNLTGDDMTTPKRKVQEIIRAINIEKNLAKNEILELYLNIVYLSENCYGVQSASKLYFGKNTSELSLAECATLASIVKNPNKYDPYKFPENNESRRQIVLKQMLDQSMISQTEYEKAVNEKISINSGIESDKSSGIYSWFTEKLIADVSEDLMEKYNLSKEGAIMMINKGGLKIYSTIDVDVQKSVDSVFESYIAYLKPQNGKYPEASCVVLDPYSSDILAIAGGVGKKSANRIFNRATDAKRPLGSVIKPLSVYAPAIELKKIVYSSVYDDTPLEVNSEPWPKNASGEYKGLVTANYALEHSINTVSVKILNDVGIENSFDFCKNKFGLNLNEINDKSEAPLALGQLTDGESLLNVTNSYTVFANGGNMNTARSYLYVTDSNGNILLSNDFESKRVISSDTAALMNIMLKNVSKNGTAKLLKCKDDMEIACKTGTSGKSCDKWIIGYSPYYACGIWVGYDTPTELFSNATSALGLFDAIMEKTHSGKDLTRKLYDSGNLISCDFCIDSGKLQTDACVLDPRLNRIETGYFVKGSEPNSNCELHKIVYVDSQSGKLANDNTHPLFRRKISLLDYVRSNKFNLRINDEKYLLSTRTNDEGKIP